MLTWIFFLSIPTMATKNLQKKANHRNQAQLLLSELFSIGIKGGIITTDLAVKWVQKGFKRQNYFHESFFNTFYEKAITKMLTLFVFFFVFL